MTGIYILVYRSLDMMMFSIARSEYMSHIQRGSVSLRILYSCNNGFPVTTFIWAELQFTPVRRNGAPKLWFRTGSFPSLYVLQSTDDDKYITNKFIRTNKYKVTTLTKIHTLNS